MNPCWGGLRRGVGVGARSLILLISCASLRKSAEQLKPKCPGNHGAIGIFFFGNFCYVVTIKQSDFSLGKREEKKASQAGLQKSLATLFRIFPTPRQKHEEEKY